MLAAEMVEAAGAQVLATARDLQHVTHHSQQGALATSHIHHCTWGAVVLHFMPLNLQTYQQRPADPLIHCASVSPTGWHPVDSTAQLTWHVPWLQASLGTVKGAALEE
jgi:hypothetical protein